MFRTTLLLSLVFFLAGNPGVSGAPAKPTVALTSAQAESYVAQLVPIVEKMSGRKFRTHPKVRITSAKAVIQILTEELVPQCRRLQPQRSDSEILQSAKTSATAVSNNLLGKYGTQTSTLYIIQENFRPRMLDCRIAPSHEQALVKLIIAHELTHALQDQYVGLARLLNSATTADQSLAISSTLEGHAVFVQEKIAQYLGLSASQKEYTRAIGVAVGADPLGNIIGTLEARIVSDTYLEGKSFIAWQMKKGGNELVWKILAQPPVKSSMILHPETYSSAEAAAIDYRALLTGLEKNFELQKWNTANTEVGEMQLRALYSDLAPNVRDSVLEQLVHAQALTAVQGTSCVYVTVLTVKKPGLFPEFISGLDELCKRNVALINSSGGAKIDSLSVGEFNSIKSDANSMICFRQNSGDEVVQNKFLRVARDKVIVEIYCQKVEISDSGLGAIAEAIFEKMPLEYCFAG